MGFRTDDRVRVVKTNCDLDGYTGVVGGLAYDHVVQTWTVILDEPYRHGGQVWKAITLPGSCLERLPEAGQ